MENWIAYIKQKENKKSLLLIIGIVSVLILIFLGNVLLSGKEKDIGIKEPPEAIESLTRQSSMTEEVSSHGSEETMIYIDLKGAVLKPGMYKIDTSMRLLDVVQQGGGFSENADTKLVNFSQKLTDQMIVYIPAKGEELPSFNEISTESQPTTEKKQVKLNINQASAQELQQLNGIGQKKAEEIVRYREEKGSFKQIEELKSVTGIGEKIYEGLKEEITV